MRTHSIYNTLEVYYFTSSFQLRGCGLKRLEHMARKLQCLDSGQLKAMFNQAIPPHTSTEGLHIITDGFWVQIQAQP